MHLMFYTLGGFTIYQHGSLLQRGMWDTTRAFTLCKLLITYYNEPLSIAQIKGWLWPNLSHSQAQATLQAALDEIDVVLQPQVKSNLYTSPVLTNDATVQWSIEGYWLDAHILLEAARTIRPLQASLDWLEHAASLYRGPYLVEDYDAEWSKARRAELARAYEKVVLNMADVHALTGDYRQALRVCRRVFAVNPTNTEAVSRLLDFAYYAAETGQALHAYSVYCTALAKRPAHEPDPRVTYKANRLRRGLPPHEPYHSGEPRRR